VAPQRPGLVETMTVAENLTLAAGLRGKPVPAAALTATAEALGLGRVLASPAAVLSGGERQRAALARALVSPAPLLLLDEPTSQQDEVSAAQVAAALHAAVAQGRGLLVASHDPALLAPAGTTVNLDRRSPPEAAVSRRRGPGPGRAAGRPGTAR
jgi:ABC-type lipoprotein export system ATPase subunit